MATQYQDSYAKSLKGYSIVDTVTTYVVEKFYLGDRFASSGWLKISLPRLSFLDKEDDDTFH
jgi:hypothetical protein